MGNEHWPELADNHWAQSLGAEWAWEPKTVPRWGSPNPQFVQIRVAVRKNCITRLSVCGLQVACSGFILDFISR